MIAKPKVTTEIEVTHQVQTTTNLRNTLFTGTVRFIDGHYYDTQLRADSGMGFTGKLQPAFLRELADTIEKGVQ